jgi:tetratricopeptide (TPR) repeat protein
MNCPHRESQFHLNLRGLTAIALVVTGLCTAGCSFNLGSLSPGGDKDEPKTTAVAVPAAPASSGRTNPQDAQIHAARALALVTSGKPAEALAAYNQAIDLDPHNAQTFTSRGLLYQSEKQYEFAIADFTSANGLTPQQPDPLLGRAQCYLALGKNQEAAADLDEASQVAPGNAQVWLTRGATYEKLGERTKAADSYSRAVTLRPRDDAARNGLARMGGRAG